jgi:predicted transcriptional regulator of viral defense system
MKWDTFIKLNKEFPVVDTELFHTTEHKPESINVQISRWEKAGKLVQVKRGIYLLAEPYRKIEIYEPYLASLLKKPSYISLEKAMEFHGLIPESVRKYISVTTKQTGKFESEAGVFEYKHINPRLFWGYESVTVNKQTAFFASPEKALLDFFYFKGMNTTLNYISEMRLQNVEKINLKTLLNYGRRFGKPGMLTVAKMLKKHILALKVGENTI